MLEPLLEPDPKGRSVRAIRAKELRFDVDQGARLNSERHSSLGQSSALRRSRPFAFEIVWKKGRPDERSRNGAL